MVSQVDGYLCGIGVDEAANLAAVNRPGLEALRSYLEMGEAVAFLGAGVSTPLYPLWSALINELVEVAVTFGLEDAVARTCRARAAAQPDAVVEILRQHMGDARFHRVLLDVFRIRREPSSGRTWTLTQELVCRCPFRGVVTTNYDPGVVDARMKVRPRASSTEFTSWSDEAGLERWLSGEMFRGVDLPVLFAHGIHTRPEEIVLATSAYRRAYAGKLSVVLDTVLRSGHVVWMGFSFADSMIAAILREVAAQIGTAAVPIGVPRHVAVMPWDPGSGEDPATVRKLADIEFGADVVLYPASGGDHTALQRLLGDFVDPRFPRALALAAPPASDVAAKRAGNLLVAWVPESSPADHFTGRGEELAKLDRWAGEASVHLIGVTAWGGAGKTALVSQWVDLRGPAHRLGTQGVFAWSFYADPSAEHWVEGLLSWARDALGLQAPVEPGGGAVGPASAVLGLLQRARVVLVLDGLEVVQEGPEGAEFGRLLDGVLREVLIGACRLDHGSLVLLTSRFPFADLEGFDGGPARMVEVPPFTPAEGGDLLARLGGGWLPEPGRRDLAEAVDGHALAVSVLGGLLDQHVGKDDLAGLREQLLALGRTDERVTRVLNFYVDRLSESDRLLLGIVSLFVRPVSTDAVLAVARHEALAFTDRSSKWTADAVRTAAVTRLSGLISLHENGLISAHPIVRDTFRRLALPAASVAVETILTSVPRSFTTVEDGLRVVEAIELLLQSDQWQDADDLYRGRSSDGELWRRLPAAQLGQRAATAFVATEERRKACLLRLGSRRMPFYLKEAGALAICSADLAAATALLQAGANLTQEESFKLGPPDPLLTVVLQDLTECHARQGQLVDARARAAESLENAFRLERQDWSNGDFCKPDWDQEKRCHAGMAWVASLAGETVIAEAEFMVADRIQHFMETSPQRDQHLHSILGVRWAEFLMRTGRLVAARRLAESNLGISSRNTWNDSVAGCNRVLASLDLADGDETGALAHVGAAAALFREGQALADLAETLPVVAAVALATGDVVAAMLAATEGIDLCGPRHLVLSRASALTVRARIHAHSAATTPEKSGTYIGQGRDNADAALRLARSHGLLWHELDALDAHAVLDSVEGANNGWAEHAETLRARLIPMGLDPDPLDAVASGRSPSWDRNEAPPWFRS